MHYMQSAKMLAFVEGKYKEIEPLAEKLAKHVASGKRSPMTINKYIEDTIQGTPLYRRLYIEGDNITVTRKQKSTSVVLEEEENASHRLEYVTHNQPRNRRQAHDNEQMATHEIDVEDSLVNEEIVLHKTMWAI